MSKQFISFSIIPLRNHATSPPPSELVSNFTRGHDLVEAESGYKCTVYQQIENPRYIYFQEAWDSVQQHTKFLMSELNMKFLKAFDDEIAEGLRLRHLGGEGLSALWEKKGEVSGFERNPMKANVMAYVRYSVKESVQREAFEAQFEKLKQHLEGITKKYQVCGGWTVEETDEIIRLGSAREGGEGALEEDKDEWIMFSGWESTEQYAEFVNTLGGFEQYGGVMELVDNCEVRSAKNMRL